MRTSLRLVTTDALQTRVARFMGEAPSERAIMGSSVGFLGTSTGQVRSENQDRALIFSAVYEGSPDRDFRLAVLCDGMGGMQAGDKAATLAISVFTTRIVRNARLPVAERLSVSASEANDAVYEIFGGRGGATLSAVLSTRFGAWGVNVGDSRIYSVGIDGKVSLRTTDDTLGAYAGRDTPLDDADNRLIQFVGLGEGLEPHVISPESNDQRGFILTSDGIHGYARDAVAQISRASDFGWETVDRSLLYSQAMGGRDNATIIVMPIEFQSLPLVEPGGHFILTSSFGRLEVWVPRPTAEPNLSSGASERSEAQRPEPDAQEEKAPKATAPRKFRKLKKKTVKSLAVAKGEPSLPLDDRKDTKPVEFHFPDDDE